MPSLPLKLQIGIRDHWDNADCSVQKSLAALKAVLGYEVIVEPEWQLLVTELDKFYDDKTVMIATIATFVATWCKKLVELLEDEGNEVWSDVLLEHLKPASRLRLYLEVATTDQLGNSWSKEKTAVVLVLPKGRIPPANLLFHTFHDKLLTIFDVPKSGGGAVAVPHRSAAASADDWAVVEKTSAQTSARRGAADILPTVSTLPRPDELLLKPPYHLIIRDRGRTEIEVTCSHSPTLQLLSEYLKKWCRVNHQDTRSPPGVEIELHQSAFGPRLVYDRLLLNVETRFSSTDFAVTTPIILALVEGVLGYEKVSVDGCIWTYRRDVPLKDG